MRRPILRAKIAMHCNPAFQNRPARFEDEGPATSPLRRSVARCAGAHRLAKRRTGRFLVWDFRPVSWRDRPCSGAGIEPATNRLGICRSTQLSYPVATCRIRTGVIGVNRCSTSEPTSSRNTFSRPRAYATATPRAPDGHANPYRWKPFDRCFALAPVQAPILVRDPTLSAWAARRPCPASGHSAHAPHSGNPFPRTVHARMLGDANRSREIRVWLHCERAKENAPGCGSEGVRVPRRSGRPISRAGNQSKKVKPSSRTGSRSARWPASR